MYKLIAQHSKWFGILLLLCLSLALSAQEEGCEPEQQTDLFIESDPPGARIYLNGVNTGQVTPFTVTALKDASQEVKLTLREYFSTSQEIQLDLSLEKNQIKIWLTSVEHFSCGGGVQDKESSSQPSIRFGTPSACLAPPFAHCDNNSDVQAALARIPSDCRPSVHCSDCDPSIVAFYRIPPTNEIHHCNSQGLYGRCATYAHELHHAADWIARLGDCDEEYTPPGEPSGDPDERCKISLCEEGKSYSTTGDCCTVQLINGEYKLAFDLEKCIDRVRGSSGFHCSDEQMDRLVGHAVSCMDFGACDGDCFSESDGPIQNCSGECIQCPEGQCPNFLGECGCADGEMICRTDPSVCISSRSQCSSNCPCPSGICEESLVTPGEFHCLSPDCEDGQSVCGTECCDSSSEICNPHTGACMDNYCENSNETPCGLSCCPEGMVCDENFEGTLTCRYSCFDGGAQCGSICCSDNEVCHQPTQTCIQEDQCRSYNRCGSNCCDILDDCDGQTGECIPRGSICENSEYRCLRPDGSHSCCERFEEICNSGTCVSECPEGKYLCGNSCCSNELSCNNNVCESECEDRRSPCNGECCNSWTTCVDGMCRACPNQCPPGFRPEAPPSCVCRESCEGEDDAFGFICNRGGQEFCCTEGQTCHECNFGCPGLDPCTNPNHQRDSSQDCECSCANPQSCGPGYTWNEESCSCEPIPSSPCVRDEDCECEEWCANGSCAIAPHGTCQPTVSCDEGFECIYLGDGEKPFYGGSCDGAGVSVPGNPTICGVSDCGCSSKNNARCRIYGCSEI